MCSGFPWTKTADFLLICPLYCPTIPHLTLQQLDVFDNVIKETKGLSQKVSEI